MVIWQAARESCARGRSDVARARSSESQAARKATQPWFGAGDPFLDLRSHLALPWRWIAHEVLRGRRLLPRSAASPGARRSPCDSDVTRVQRCTILTGDAGSVQHADQGGPCGSSRADTCARISSATALVGFGCFGIGVATIVPTAFYVAGNTRRVPPAWGLAQVTTMGYAGLLSSPTVIGFVSHAAGLTWALAIPATLLLLVPALSPAVPGRSDHL